MNALTIDQAIGAPGVQGRNSSRRNPATSNKKPGGTSGPRPRPPIVDPFGHRPPRFVVPWLRCSTSAQAGRSPMRHKRARNPSANETNPLVTFMRASRERVRVKTFRLRCEVVASFWCREAVCQETLRMIHKCESCGFCAKFVRNSCLCAAEKKVCAPRKTEHVAAPRAEESAPPCAGRCATARKIFSAARTDTRTLLCQTRRCRGRWKSAPRQRSVWFEVWLGSARGHARVHRPKMPRNRPLRSGRIVVTVRERITCGRTTCGRTTAPACGVPQALVTNA